MVRRACHITGKYRGKDSHGENQRGCFKIKLQAGQKEIGPQSKQDRKDQVSTKASDWTGELKPGRHYKHVTDEGTDERHLG